MLYTSPYYIHFHSTCCTLHHTAYTSIVHAVHFAMSCAFEYILLPPFPLHHFLHLIYNHCGGHQRVLRPNHNKPIFFFCYSVRCPKLILPVKQRTQQQTPEADDEQKRNPKAFLKAKTIETSQPKGYFKAKTIESVDGKMVSFNDGLRANILKTDEDNSFARLFGGFNVFAPSVEKRNVRCKCHLFVTQRKQNYNQGWGFLFIVFHSNKT